MRFSIQSKILILSLSTTLIGTLSLGVLSTLFISRTTQRNSMQYMKDQARTTCSNPMKNTRWQPPREFIRKSRTTLPF